MILNMGHWGPLPPRPLHTQAHVSSERGEGINRVLLRRLLLSKGLVEANGVRELIVINLLAAVCVDLRAGG